MKYFFKKKTRTGEPVPVFINSAFYGINFDFAFCNINSVMPCESALIYTHGILQYFISLYKEVIL